MSESATVWNESAGRAWVQMQEVLDRLFRPLEDRLVDAVARAGGSAVLDVGCGTGGTTLAIARRLGPGGACTGVDVSEPMIDAARRRPGQDGLGVEFVVADAGRHPFPPAALDVVASRLGVMFFDDPVAAFANLRAATRAGGALAAIVWRGAADNPFMTTAERAAAPVLTIPPRDPDEPGQFAFGDPDRVLGILADAGWRDPALDPVDVEVALPADRLGDYLTRLGPVGRALAGADAATRERVVEVVRPAFDEFVHGDEVRFTAACRLVTAIA